jgi:KDO2-lipid IV(A) lauroyltransferase
MARRGSAGQWWLRHVQQPLRRSAAILTAEFLRLLPLETASSLFGGFARRIGPWLPISNRARRNLDLAFPGLAPEERERIVAGMWENLGRVVCDYAHLDSILMQADRRVEIVGAEHLDALRDDGRTGILFSAHFSSWEMVTVAALMRQLPVHVVYRNANNPGLDAYIRRRQGASGVELIRKGPRGARRLIEVMRAGGHAILLVDQKMNDGIAVPFLGRPAMTAPALAQLAYRYDCPVVPVRVERLPHARFRVTCGKPLQLPQTGDKAADILAAMTAVNAEIEGWIRARPQDWLWLHRRWPEETV